MIAQIDIKDRHWALTVEGETHLLRVRPRTMKDRKPEAISLLALVRALAKVMPQYQLDIAPQIGGSPFLEKRIWVFRTYYKNKPDSWNWEFISDALLHGEKSCRLCFHKAYWNETHWQCTRCKARYQGGRGGGWVRGKW